MLAHAFFFFFALLQNRTKIKATHIGFPFIERQTDEFFRIKSANTMKRGNTNDAWIASERFKKWL